MVEDQVSVRQATQEDKSAIFDFIRNAYPNRYQQKIPDCWEWKFENNPFRDPDFLPIWIAIDERNGAIVGHSNAIIERLWIDGSVYLLSWGDDLFVKPDYRGLGIRNRLQKASVEGSQIFISLNFAGTAQHINDSIRMESLPPIPIFTRVIRHESKSVLKGLVNQLAQNNPSLKKVLTIILKFLLVPYILSWILSMRETWRDWTALDNLDLNLAVPDVETFDESINSLWRRVSPRFEALVMRDVTYLNWKFTKQPDTKYTRFVARRENDILGYMVVQVAAQNVGTIVDLFAAPEDEKTICTLLIHAIRYFRREKVGSIEIANSIEEYQLLLQSLGFKKNKEVSPMIQAPEEVSDKKWLLSMGDIRHGEEMVSLHG